MVVNYNFSNCNNVTVNVGKGYENPLVTKLGKPRNTICARILRGETVYTSNRVRFNPVERLAIMAKLAEKGGLKCQDPNCKFRYENDVDALALDHIDNNPLHNSLDNLQILCCVCNTKKGLKKTRV